MRPISCAYSLPEALGLEAPANAIHPDTTVNAKRLFDVGFRAVSDLLVIAENTDIAAAITVANATGQRFSTSFRDKTVWLFQPPADLVTEIRRLEIA